MRIDNSFQNVYEQDVFHNKDIIEYREIEV